MSGRTNDSRSKTVDGYFRNLLLTFHKGRGKEMKELLMAMGILLMLSGGAVATDRTFPMAQNNPLYTEMKQSPSISQQASLQRTGILGENFRLTAGLKVWRANYRQNMPSFSSGSVQSEGKTIDGSSNMYGGAVSLTYKDRFNLGYSYYGGSGFEDSVDFYNEGEKLDELSLDLDKTDVDAWLGYYVHPRVSIFLGYKYSKMDLSGKLDLLKISITGESFAQGPVIGVNGNYPLGESGLVFFGTLAYASLSTETETLVESSLIDYYEYEKSSGDSRGLALEAGAVYMFPSLPKLSFSLGYKHQRYENPDNSDDYFSVSGFALGLNYSL